MTLKSCKKEKCACIQDTNSSMYGGRGNVKCGLCFKNGPENKMLMCMYVDLGCSEGEGGRAGNEIISTKCFVLFYLNVG